MRMSPDSRRGRIPAIVLSTTAAGTIIQTARGLASFPTKSTSDDDPVAFSFASSCTAFGDMSKTTQPCPFLMSRRTMFAPMRPSPIIPSCIALSSGSLFPVTANQRVGRAVVRKLRLRHAFEFRNDPLRQDLAELHTPLVERIDMPDRPLREHAVLVQRDELPQR